MWQTGQDLARCHEVTSSQSLPQSIVNPTVLLSRHVSVCSVRVAYNEQEARQRSPGFFYVKSCRASLS